MESTNSEAIRSFVETYEFETAPIGETIVLPDNGQVFEIIAQVLFDYGAGHVEPAGYQWATPCVVCGVRHIFVTPREFRSLTRLCPEHAGQWRAPRAVKAGAKAPRAPKTKPRSAVQLVVIGVWEALRAVRGDAMRREILVDNCVKRLPEPASGVRDVRRQNVQRSIDRLLRPSTAGAPPFVQIGEMMFHRGGERN